MVSSEFKLAVSEENLLRVRIMIKDSLILDPTFSLLNEMIDYAKLYCIDLYEPYDGGYLESDFEKWNEETLNRELVRLVKNFSDVRIEHLKKVVSKLMENEANKINEERQLKKNSVDISKQTMSDIRIPSKSKRSTIAFKSNERKNILSEIKLEANRINVMLSKIDDEKELTEISGIREATKNLLKLIRKYELYNK